MSALDLNAEYSVNLDTQSAESGSPSAVRVKGPGKSIRWLPPCIEVCCAAAGWGCRRAAGTAAGWSRDTLERAPV